LYERREAEKQFRNQVQFVSAGSSSLTEVPPNAAGLQNIDTKTEEQTAPSKWDQPEPTPNALEAFIKSKRQTTSNSKGGGYAEYVKEQRKKAERKQ
jgi:hypothetical protein